MSRACEREEAVVRALLEGDLGTVEGHVAACPECRETVAIAGWMQDVARAAREEAAGGLPGASEIWWRAEVLARVDRRRELVRRAVRPIALFERWVTPAAAGVLAILGWLYGGRLLDVGWAAELGAILTDPEWIARIGITVAALLVVSTGVLVERLRDV